MPQHIKGLHEGFAFLCMLASDNYFLYFSSVVFVEILNISISMMPLYSLARSLPKADG